MDEMLFRTQVIEARRRRLLGEVALTQARRGEAAVIVLVMAVAGLAAWAFTAKYARTEDVVGFVVADQDEAKVIPVRPGAVKTLFVREGGVVHQGQPIAYVVSDLRNQALVDVTAEAQQALVEQAAGAERRQHALDDMAQSEATKLELNLKTALDTVSSTAQQIALQRTLVDSLEGTLHRIEPLATAGYVSKLDYERRQQEVIAAKQRLGELTQAANSAAVTVRLTQEQIRAHPREVAAQAAQAQMEIDGLRQQLARTSTDGGYTLVSPVDGVVTTLQAAPGQAVDGKFPLATVRPSGTAFEVELLAPSRAVGFIKPDQPVNLMFDAFPYKQFGASQGRVLQVADSAIAPRELNAPVDVQEPVYRVRVRLDRQYVAAFGAQFPLHGGMVTRASVILDRRTFVDWLLQPIRAVKGRA